MNWVLRFLFFGISCMNMILVLVERNFFFSDFCQKRHLRLHGMYVNKADFLNPFPHIVTKAEIAKTSNFSFWHNVFHFLLLCYSIIEWITYVLTKYIQSRLLQKCRMRERVKYSLHAKEIRDLTTWCSSNMTLSDALTAVHILKHSCKRRHCS